MESFAAGSGGPQRPTAHDDLIQPFKIEGQAVRGRLVRLGPLIDTVLDRHQYPPVVAELLGEMVALAAALAGALKYDGVFTLQIKGDGPIHLMVADVTSDGDVRGYAQFDADRVASVVRTGNGGSLSVPKLLGAGYLAFTVDQGSHTERYQGIVELTGATLADCIHHYFQQSEQLDAAVKVTAGRAPGGWRAGALMLQRLPPSAGAADDVEDGWRRTLAFMASSTPEELLDAQLAPNDLLYRLFHEDGVRVFATADLRAGCRCSRERVERVLRSLPDDDLETFKVDGLISVTCEFCSASYDFTDGEVAALKQS
ncbi:MAG: Hsp33 family molecular chaperone HslO [Dongiaceae bacterium]